MPRFIDREKKILLGMFSLFTFAGNILMYVGGRSSEKTEDKAYAISLDLSVEVPRFGYCVPF